MKDRRNFLKKLGVGAAGAAAVPLAMAAQQQQTKPKAHPPTIARSEYDRRVKHG